VNVFKIKRLNVSVSFKKRLPVLGAGLVVFGCSTTVMGLELGVEAFGDLRSTDNAEQALDGSFDEIISEYGLKVSTANIAENYSYDLAYDYSKTTYDENSQDDVDITTGYGGMHFGKKEAPLGLDIVHSRERTLIGSGVSDNLENSDVRSITDIDPNLKLKLGAVDFLIISAGVTEIRYQEQELKDSTRYGGELQWAHRVSRTTSFGLMFEHSEVELELYDYKYDKAIVNYQAELRNIAYDLSAGYNRTVSDEIEFNAPSYDVNIRYIDDTRTLGMRISSDITDTSLGDSNRSGIQQAEDNIELGQADATAVAADRFRSTTYEISLSDTNFQDHWNIDFVLGREREVYKEFSDEDSTNIYGRMSVKYAFNRRTDFGYERRQSKIKFDSGELRGAEDVSDRLAMELKFSEMLEATFYVGRNEWLAASGTVGYTENLFGLRANYIVY
jgi:hypothetical protein